MKFLLGQLYPPSVPAFFVIANEVKQPIELFGNRNDKKELHSSRVADSS